LHLGRRQCARGGVGGSVADRHTQRRPALHLRRIADERVLRLRNLRGAHALCPAPGTVSAFFTFTGSPHGPQRPHDEIDFEFLGKNPNEVFLNYFASGRKHEQYVPLPFDATTTTNDFAFEWTAEGIRWFANGRLIREVKASSAGADLPVTPQKIYVSIWNGTGQDQEAWLGRFAYPGRPLVATFERVAFTEAGAPCQFPESVVCRKQ
jgi:endo-1,3-1,4-beta-glycanase ExoK